MSWQLGNDILAEPSGLHVTGKRAAGGADLDLAIAFHVNELPPQEKGPLSLVPQPALVEARTRGGELRLGHALPSPVYIIVPGDHRGSAVVHYTLPMSSAALAALEAARDGSDLSFSLALVAHALVPGSPLQPVTDMYHAAIAREQWLACLRSAGFCETLVTELCLPTVGPDDTAAARQRFFGAVESRNSGSYAEAMRRCRTALDALKTAGFGGKAPQEVVQFLKNNAGTMPPSERIAALRAALFLFLSPANHANAPEESYSRADAELAIAMTAALLRLVDARATTAERIVADGGEGGHV